MNVKSLILNIAIYGFLNIFVKLLNYLTVPLQTLILTPNEFGSLTEIYTYIGLAQIIYSFGLETIYFRFSHLNNNLKNIAFSFIIGINLTISIFILFISNYLSQLLQIEKCNLYAAISILIIDSITIVPFSELRVLNKIKQYSLIKLLQIVINILLTLFITLNNNQQKGHNIFLLLITNTISNAIAIPFAIYNIGGINFEFQFKMVKKLIFYALPIVIINFIALMNEAIPRLGLKYFQNTNNCYDVGIYGASQKIASILTIGLQAYKFGIEPMFFKKHKKELQWYDNAMHWFISIMCCSIIFITLNVNFFAKIFLRKKIFYSAIKLVPYLLFTNFFAGIYYNLSVWYKAKDKNILGSVIGLIGCVVNVTLSYFLIPNHNYFGSIIASYSAYIIMIVFSYTIGKKFLPISYSIGTFMTYIIFTIIIVCALKDYDNKMINFFASILACFLILIYTYIYHRITRKINDV